MKKNLLWMAIFAIGIFSISSCNNTIGVDDELKPTKLTVEEQKEKIEANGIAFIDKMDGMKETVAYKTLTNFVEDYASKASPQIRQLKSAMEGRNLKNINVLGNQLKSSSANDDEVWGEWVWDADVEDFEKVKDISDKIILKFPASSSSKTNNAEITIDYIKSKVEIPDADEFYPSDVTCVFKVDGAVAMKASFNGTYKTDGTPTKVVNSLELEDYKWESTLINDTKKASEDYKFSYKSETLIQMKAELNGDITYSNLEDIEDFEEFSDLVSGGNIYFQMMDLAILGGVTDLKKFIDEAEALDKTNLMETDEEKYYKKAAEIMNNNIKLWACFTDDKRKFADVEFYFNEYTDYYTYYDYYWNGYYYETKAYEQAYTDYELLPRFILSDGSKVDIEEFFEAGFDGLLDRLEEMAEDIENDFE